MEGYVTYGEGIFASDYALKNLSKALAQAQLKYDRARKETENKFEGFRYVDLDTLIRAVRPALADHGLTVIQFATSDLESKSVTIRTCLTHPESGEWMSNELTLPAEGVLGKDGTAKFNQKTLGAAITYGRKYGLKTLVGISDSDDDDVDKQEGSPDLRARSTAKKTPAPPPAEPESDTPDPKSPLSPLHRKTLLFDACYSLGGTNDTILAAVKKVTGKDSSKLVTYGDVERIKAEVYKAANPGSGIDPLLDAAVPGDVSVP